jgi:MFS superfamily sulfate permease-like transporter
MELKKLFKERKQELSAGIALFFVAVTVYTGNAWASDAPFFAGIMSGIRGGIAVAVALAGIIHLILGFAKAGLISSCFPPSVINGLRQKNHSSKPWVKKHKVQALLNRNHFQIIFFNNIFLINN